jgi:signal peptidase II
VRVAAVKTRLLPFAVAAGVVLLDQLTKWWVVATLPGDPIVVVEGFFQLRYIQNPGSAFGMFPGAGGFLAVAAVVAALVIVSVVRKLERPSEQVAMGLVLGGAVGNLGDRLFRGAGLLDGKVVDWIDFDFFPAFNVADSAITLGAGLALLVAFVFHGSEG